MGSAGRFPVGKFDLWNLFAVRLSDFINKNTNLCPFVSIYPSVFCLVTLDHVHVFDLCGCNRGDERCVVFCKKAN